MDSDSLKIWLMSGGNEAERNFYQKVFKKFKKEYKIEVDFQPVSWTRVFERLMKAYKQNKAPDIFQLGTTWVQSLAHLDYLAEVPDFISRPPLAEWLNDCCSYKNKKVAIPWYGEVRSMLGNKELMEKYGVDIEKIRKREYFYKFCQKIARERKSNPEVPLPCVIPIRPELGTLNLYLAWSFAGGWRFPDLNPVPDKILNEKSFIKNFNFLADLLKKCHIDIEKMQKHPSVLYEEFLQGKYVFYMGNWHIRSLDERVKDSVYSIIPIPISRTNEKRWAGGSVLGVFSGSKYPELSWRLIEMLTSAEYIEEWVEVTGDLPSFKTEFWENNRDKKGYRLYYNMIQNSVTYPPHPMWYKIENVLRGKITNYLRSIIQDSDTQKYAKILGKLDQQIIRLLKLGWDLNY
ncbi:MAG: extracellular solute-binding protein [Bacillota bacterium]